ncbi:hypothetical protein ACQP2X_19415 [Actinoplanes sp. CA-131856]
MRPGLLFAEAPEAKLADGVADDLGLSAVIDAMAAGDPEIAATARRVLLSGPIDAARVAYRQDILDDCVREPDLGGQLYELAGRALEAQRAAARAVFFDTPETLLSQATITLTSFVELLRELRTLAERYGPRVSSAGFRQFFTMVGDHLNEDYLESAAEAIRQLGPRGNLLVSARLGSGNQSEQFVVAGHRVRRDPCSAVAPRRSHPPRPTRFPTATRPGTGR